MHLTDEACSSLSLHVVHKDETSFTILLDPEFYETSSFVGTHPSTWISPQVCNISPFQFPSVTLYVRCPSDKASSQLHIFAIRFVSKLYDMTEATRLLAKYLTQWIQELSVRLGSTCPSHTLSSDHATDINAYAEPSKASVSGAHKNQNTKTRNPTLFNLLMKLGCSHQITLEQRTAIKRIVKDYLNYDICQGKMFSYLSQAVGYQTFGLILASLNTQGNEPNESFSYLDSEERQSQALLNETPSKKRGRSYVKHKHYAAFFYKAFISPLIWRPLVWKSCEYGTEPQGYGERLLVFDEKVFFIGGQSSKVQSSSSLNSPLEFKQGTRERVAIYSYDSIGMGDIVDFTALQKVETYLLSPSEVYANQGPSCLKDHSLHLGAFASGPVFILYGGRFTSDNENVVSLNSHVLGFNLLSKYWVVLDTASNHCPPPRHSYASALLPLSCNEFTAMDYTEYLIIFGGVGFPWVLRQQDYESVSFNNTFNQKECSYIQRPLADLVVLGDLWIFNFLTATWTCIELDFQPEKRFGASFFCVDSSTFFLLGGETRLSYHEYLKEDMAKDLQRARTFAVPYGRPTLFNDTWALTFHDSKLKESLDDSEYLQSLFTWTRVQDNGTTSPRAHYAALALTACYPSTLHEMGPNNFYGDPFSHWWSPYAEDALQYVRQNGFSTQRTLFAISGTTMNRDGLFYETPSLLVGFLMPDYAMKKPFQISWKIVDCIQHESNQARFQGRRGHSAIYVTASSNMKYDSFDENDQTLGPAMLHKKGSPDSVGVTDAQVEQGDTREILNNIKMEDGRRDQTRYKHKKVCCILVTRGITSRGEYCDDYWILQLSCTRHHASLQHPTNWLTRAVFSGIQMFKNTSCLAYPYQELSFLDDSSFSDEMFVSSCSEFSFCSPSKNAYEKLNNLPLNDWRTIEDLWNNPTLNFQSSTYQKGPFISPSLPWILATTIVHPFSCIAYFLENACDPSVNSTTIQVSFETWRSYESLVIKDNGNGLSQEKLYSLLNQFGTSRLEFSEVSNQFGLGFKLAASRLAHHCLILTKTKSCYGVGLFSLPLNAMFDSNHFFCPMTCWSTRTHSPVVSPIQDYDFSRSLNLILSHSPLKTRKALQEEFNSFQYTTGTRFILYTLRKDVPYLYKTQQGRISFTSHKALHLVSSSATAPFYMTLDKSQKNETVTESGLSVKDDVQRSTLTHEGFSDSNGSAGGKIGLQNFFPCYECFQDSLDYSLATYMFWLHLHTSQKLFLNGMELRQDNRNSVNSDLSTQRVDDFPLTLWSFLHCHLCYKVELKSVPLHASGSSFTMLVGFLNTKDVVHQERPKELNSLSESKYSDSEKPRRICETGVLLYSNGRFIKRCLSRLPAIPDLLQPLSTEIFPKCALNILTQNSLTVIINVPSNFCLRPTKEDFHFKDKKSLEALYHKEELLTLYIKALFDEAQLKNLQNMYA